MKIALDIDPTNLSDLNRAVALLVSLGAVYQPTANGAHLTIPVPPTPVDPQVAAERYARATGLPDTSMADDVAAAEAAFGGAGNVPAPAAGNPATSTPPIVSSPPAPPSVPPAAVATAGVELDKNGLPWDGRIHAGTRGKNADGSWTAKRGVDKTTVPAVEAELRAVMALPGASAAPAAIIPPPPPAPLIPPPPPAPAVTPQAGGPITFADLVHKIGALTVAGSITEADVASALASVGMPALPVAGTRPDLLPQIAATLDAIAASRG